MSRHQAGVQGPLACLGTAPHAWRSRLPALDGKPVTIDAPFVLGTVQLGLPYGVANAAGMPSEAEAYRILDAAIEAGVTTLDTAHAYAQSQSVIGAWRRSRNATPQIVSKTPASDHLDADRARNALADSLETLGVESLAGLLLHRPHHAREPGILAWAEREIAERRVEAFGVSVYHPDEIVDSSVITLIQLPGSIFNQAAASHRAVQAVERRGGRIFIRSVLAQGLVLMEPDRIPDALAAARPHVEALQRLANGAGVPVAALAIAAVRNLFPNGELVLGAETCEQVRALASASRCFVEPGLIDAALALGREAPPGVFDPREWKLTG